MDDSESQFSLTHYSQVLWEELHRELPPAAEYERCGTIWVAADDEEMAEVRRKYTYYRDRGVHTEILDPQALHQAEPHLRVPLAGGLLVEGDSVIYPPAAASFLLEKAVEFGASLHFGKAVIALAKGNARLADGTTLSAGRLINAAGQFSPKLTPGIQVKPRKGHLVITDRYPGFVHHQIVELGYLKSAHCLGQESVAFNIQPRKTGQLLIGSSRQFDAEETNVDQSILDRMLQRAIEYLPGLRRLSAIRVWTGHRAATPDKLPLIGPSVTSNRIWLATGHEGLGITTSLGTGRLLADLLLGRPTEIPAAPYSPKRFVNELVAHA
jgi:glycine/D-amino acid oxidase-like deaminating enzyme